MAFVESVLAPEFVSTYDDGTSRRQESVNCSWSRNSTSRWNKEAIDEFTIKVFGNSAVVWFTQRMSGPGAGENRPRSSGRYIDVFVNRDGKWLCVCEPKHESQRESKSFEPFEIAFQSRSNVLASSRHV